MSYAAKILPVMLTVVSAVAQAQATPYSATVVEDPASGNYVKTNVVVSPALMESHFGDKNVWVLGGGTKADISGRHQDSDFSKTNTLNLGLNIMGGQFVAHNFLLGMTGSIGASLQYGKLKSLDTAPDAGYKGLATEVGPLVGYNVRINENASFLPTLAALYDYSQFWVPGSTGYHSHGISIDVGLGFVLNVTRHINVLVGPYVTQGVFNQTDSSDPADAGATAVVGDGNSSFPTSYGLRASVLGWR